MAKVVKMDTQKAGISKVMELVDSLPQPKQDAIAIIKLALDCYNSYDGSGLFVGMDRYKKLQERLKISAMNSQESLFEFWSDLLRRMKWSLPPKSADSLIVYALTGKDEREVLKSILNDTPSLISIARLLHDSDKDTRKALWAEDLAEQQAIDAQLESPETDKIPQDELGF